MKSLVSTVSLPASGEFTLVAGEEHYCTVHRWLQVRLAGREDEEMSLRKTLRANQPALFRYLRERAAAVLRTEHRTRGSR